MLYVACCIIYSCLAPAVNCAASPPPPAPPPPLTVPPRLQAPPPSSSTRFGRRRLHASHYFPFSPKTCYHNSQRAICMVQNITSTTDDLPQGFCRTHASAHLTLVGPSYSVTPNSVTPLAPSLPCCPRHALASMYNCGSDPSSAPPPPCWACNLQEVSSRSITHS